MPRFVNGWADTAVNVAIFPIIVGDLVDRVRPEDKAYIVESRGKRLGTTDFAGFQAKAREKGVAAFRAALEPARRVLKEQKFLSGEAPAYPDYILLGSLLWPRTISPLELLDKDDVGLRLARAHARPVRRHGAQGAGGGVRYDAVVFDLLTALLDSWTLWNAVAGSAEAGMRWRRRYLEITYGCGSYRPYETLVREAARDVGLPEGLGGELERRWLRAAAVARSAGRPEGRSRCRSPSRPIARSGWAGRRPTRRRAVQARRDGREHRLLQAAARGLSRRAAEARHDGRSERCSSRARRPTCRARRRSACRSTGTIASACRRATMRGRITSNARSAR